ncbi:unnamed protein product [Pedinophyceae sp. YPF-701]|nr:unnamed protein product [Pedinophyceae sp. YPF-701]
MDRALRIVAAVFFAWFVAFPGGANAQQHRLHNAVVALATPVHGSEVDYNYMMSVVRAMDHINANGAAPGISLRVLGVQGISDVALARAAVVAAFLSRPELTHLLWVDADVSFEPEQIIRLVRSGKGIAVGAYPVSSGRKWDEVVRFARGKSPDDPPPPNHLLNGMSHFLSYAPLPHPTPAWDLPKGYYQGYNEPDEHGFLPIAQTGLGFVLMERGVLEDMVEKYNFLSYQHPVLGSLPGLFRQDVVQSPEGPMEHSSEDYAFCDRARAAGHVLWLDTKGGGVKHNKMVAHNGRGWFGQAGSRAAPFAWARAEDA